MPLTYRQLDEMIQLLREDSAIRYKMGDIHHGADIGGVADIMSGMRHKLFSYYRYPWTGTLCMKSSTPRVSTNVMERHDSGV